MKTKTLRHTISLNASAHDVYEMLMDEKKHALFKRGFCTDQPECRVNIFDQ